MMRVYRQAWTTGEPIVPLTDEYPLAVVFITAPRPDVSGLTEIVPIGTGFVVGWPHTKYPDAYSTYVVTAKHVIEQEPETYLRMRRKDGGLEDVRVRVWLKHESTTADVAVAVFSLPSSVSVIHVSVRDFMGSPIPQSDKVWRPSLGDSVYFIGLLDLFRGMVERNVPMVRSGSLGALYQDDVPVRTDPMTVRYLHAHLIDCRSYGGFSGSPCFVQGSPDLAKPSPGHLQIKRPGRFLGLISGHFDMWRDARTNDSSIAVKSEINSGVGVVATAEQILEVLMSDEVAKRRSEREDAYTKQQEEGAAIADMVSPETEFERFESLTRKLVGTPKSEIDKKRKDES
jgi:hypothetical protein